MRQAAAVIMLLCVPLAVSAATVQQFLASELGPPASVEDLGGGEAYVISGGSHDGHQALRWPLLDFPATSTRYALQYHVCADRDAHPQMVDLWPREGGLGIGLPRPSGANFYGAGFLDVLVDGTSLGPWLARIERLEWERATGYRFTWRLRDTTLSVTAIGHEGSDHLLLHGEIDAPLPPNSFEVTLRCFPSSFSQPRERFVRTVERELVAGDSALLAPNEWWALCADRRYDEATLPAESAGPCAFAYDPLQMARVNVTVSSYPVSARLELRPDQTSFDIALWEFPDTANDAAFAALEDALGGLQGTEERLAPMELVEAPPRVLVSEGRPAATIVVPVEATVREMTAARDLQLYLQRMSGAYLPVAREGETTGGNRVLLGAVAGHSYRAVPAGRAGFELRTDGRDVLIRGEDDFATLYGACELLERLGVRWYLPDRIGEVVPERSTIEVPELDEVQRPDFAMRWIGRSEWSYRNKCNGPAGEIGKGFSVEPRIYHSQYNFMGADDYFDEHPEWFALENGVRVGDTHAKPCTTNPEVIRKTAANMAAYLDAHPEASMIGLSFTDHAHYCQCPDCTALDEQDVPRDQSMSRRTLIFYNAVAEELVKTHPEARILAGAYHVYTYPPKDRDITAHPALSLVLCHYNSYCNIHPMNDPTCPPNVEFARLLADWQRLIPDVYIYEYYHSDGSQYLPWPLVRPIRQDIPYLREIGSGGLYTQYAQVWNTFLSYYVAAELLWDADADVDALLEEFYANFFGPAEQPMAAHFTTLINAIGESEMHACTCSLGGRGPRNIFTPELLAHLRAHLEEAKRLAAEEPLVTARLRKIDASQEYAERLMAYLDVRDAVQRMRPGAERQAAAVDALAMIEGLYDEITRDPRRWEGVCSPGSYHWRGLLPRAREMAAAPQIAVGETLRDLPTEWRFALDREDVGETEGWFAPEFDDAQWATISVLDYWENQGYEAYDGVAWYRTAVEITEEDAAATLLLAFAGVDAGATVYVNGTQIGEHEGWDESFALEIPREALKAGEENAIAVRVTDTSGNGGFYGPVRLARPGE